MTRYLVAAATSATTEAASDYLIPRLTDEDEVWVLTVEEEGVAIDRDALSTAQVKLVDATTVRTVRREGDPASEIVSFVRENDIDEVILGPRREGGEGFSTIGTTTRTVLNKVEGPVFVVPK
ncbi:universal stress protein [Haloglomus litoreum]|uniref:universal stress protein n=1 Tax=Haloglomus litoreum TaxID=3034026 RepID=UPI0023E83F95|nr:universal stress protein [Haloglomus sp. DT116]